MVKELVEMLTEIDNSDEYFALTADIMMKMYKAFRSVGFTDDQATKFIVAQCQALHNS